MNRTIIFGVLAAAATVAVGSGWQIATRLGVSTTLAPLDLALLRYGIPALLLSPILCREGLLPAPGERRALLVIVIGAGFPFGFVGMAGAQFAPAAHMGALIPGAMPLFVALLSALLLGERFSRERLAGLGAIALGITAIVGPALLETNRECCQGAWRGHLLFLSAGTLWAAYTIAYRRSSLSPWHAAAVICFWSSIMAVPVWLLAGGTKVASAPLGDVALQVIVQGVLAGVVGLAAYSIAVRNLGASVAATTGALVPVCTAAGGVALLSEPIDQLTLFGVVATTVGVALVAKSRAQR